ncbi:uncharacterized protein LOC129721842 [Wyeomyia smithii]|uniref:uncharacterized protein LOC129721842 n=1 Tax=Wyeomyia smithii TaxID=174621 RepID=UPI002467DF2D|nr:uncharacterized protein LOC129721842 [Wyeomyia smithii]
MVAAKTVHRSEIICLVALVSAVMGFPVTPDDEAAHGSPTNAAANFNTKTVIASNAPSGSTPSLTIPLEDDSVSSTINQLQELHNRQKRVIIFRPIFVYRQQQLKKQNLRRVRQEEEQQQQQVAVTTTTINRAPYIRPQCFNCYASRNGY